MKIKRITLLLCLACIYNCFLPEKTIVNLIGSVDLNNTCFDRNKAGYINILSSFLQKELVSGKNKNIIIIEGACYAEAFYNFTKSAPDFNLINFNEAIS
jgi:hypothetical protein